MCGAYSAAGRPEAAEDTTRCGEPPGRYLIAAARFMSSLSAAGSTTRERTTDIRARLARRKALKPLLKGLLVRDPYNLPAELLPHILTWVGYDLIHNFPGEYYYQTDQLWDPDPGRPERESDSESETVDPANQFSILGTN